MSARISLALAAFVTVAICCCSGLGGLLGGVEFTTGDFADVPGYPGSTQSTDSVSGMEAMLAVFRFIPGQAEWKHYKTTDSESDVLDWYENVLPTHGWDVSSAEDMGTSYENSAFYAKTVGDTEVMLVILILPDTDNTGYKHIVIGRIEMPIETVED